MGVNPMMVNQVNHVGLGKPAGGSKSSYDAVYDTYGYAAASNRQG